MLARARFGGLSSMTCRGSEIGAERCVERLHDVHHARDPRKTLPIAIMRRPTSRTGKRRMLTTVRTYRGFPTPLFANRCKRDQDVETSAANVMSLRYRRVTARSLMRLARRLTD